MGNDPVQGGEKQYSQTAATCMQLTANYLSGGATARLALISEHVDHLAKNLGAGVSKSLLGLYVEHILGRAEGKALPAKEETSERTATFLDGAILGGLLKSVSDLNSTYGGLSKTAWDSIAAMLTNFPVRPLNENHIQAAFEYLDLVISCGEKVRAGSNEHLFSPICEATAETVNSRLPRDYLGAMHISCKLELLRSLALTTDSLLTAEQIKVFGALVDKVLVRWDKKNRDSFEVTEAVDSPLGILSDNRHYSAAKSDFASKLSERIELESLSESLKILAGLL